MAAQAPAADAAANQVDVADERAGPPDPREDDASLDEGSTDEEEEEGSDDGWGEAALLERHKAVIMHTEAVQKQMEIRQRASPPDDFSGWTAHLNELDEERADLIARLQRRRAFAGRRG